MSVAVKKLEGVQSVNVSLNNGLVSIQLAPGNHVTLPELRRLITANGFSPKEATIVGDGMIESSDGAPVIRLDVTNEVLVLIPSQHAARGFEDVKRTATEHAHVELIGRVDPPRGKEELAVESLRRLP